MRPKLLDAGGVLSNRIVKAGEAIGQVGNYSGHENGTSYHLHFDIQVPTRAGWIYVSPYMTLVAAYERLIGGRGAEFTEDVVASNTVTLNDGSVGTRFTLASVRHAILGTIDRVAPVADAPPPHWRRIAVREHAARCGSRARHCAARQMASVHHFRGFRGYHRRATVWRYRRHHI
jgi:murein DD-endopeptidase MepM/ murein hydrolase activator NlpD